jgi:hypothetical protein
VVEEFSPRRAFHDQVELPRSFDDFVELDDVGMPDRLQDVDLAGHALDICEVNDPFLFKDFDRNRFPCKEMRAELDLSKGPFADGPADHVMPHFLSRSAATIFFLIRLPVTIVVLLIHFALEAA